MKTRLFERTASLCLSVLFTAAMLSGIDSLASHPEVSPQWAAAVMSATRG